MKFEQWWEKYGRQSAVHLIQDDYERSILDLMKTTAKRTWGIASVEILLAQVIKESPIEA